MLTMLASFDQSMAPHFALIETWISEREHTRTKYHTITTVLIFDDPDADLYYHQQNIFLTPSTQKPATTTSQRGSALSARHSRRESVVERERCRVWPSQHIHMRFCCLLPPYLLHEICCCCLLLLYYCYANMAPSAQRQQGSRRTSGLARNHWWIQKRLCISFVERISRFLLIVCLRHLVLGTFHYLWYSVSRNVSSAIRRSKLCTGNSGSIHRGSDIATDPLLEECESTKYAIHPWSEIIVSWHGGVNF